MSTQTSTHKSKGVQAKEKAPVQATKKHHVKLPFVFGRMNYILTLVSLAVLVLGFIVMSGGKGDIYDARRITVAPIIVIIGFLLGFVAIFWKDKNAANANDHQQHHQE